MYMSLKQQKLNNLALRYLPLKTSASKLDTFLETTGLVLPKLKDQVSGLYFEVFLLDIDLFTFKLYFSYCTTVKEKV